MKHHEKTLPEDGQIVEGATSPYYTNRPNWNPEASERPVKMHAAVSCVGSFMAKHETYGRLSEEGIESMHVGQMHAVVSCVAPFMAKHATCGRLSEEGVESMHVGPVDN
jgi:predicted HNH restriction endonuclease